MARTVKPLVDKTIREAKPKVTDDGLLKSYTLADGNGLHLLIKIDGKKLWEFVYKSPTRLKRRKTSFGNYPQTTLKRARELRAENLELIKQGIDPLDHKALQERQKKQDTESSFIAIADEWLKFDSQKTTPLTHKRKKAVFEKEIYPYFKDKSINEITHQDIIKVIEIKTKQGYLESANKLYRYLRTVWKYAITKGLCKYNPFNDIMKELVIVKKEVEHYPKITDEATLKELINKIDNYSGHYSVKSALQFVLHVPLRADNLCNLTW